MKAVVQRVSSASVTVNGEVVGKIGNGLLVLLGIKKDDTEKDQEKIIKKILNLRVFADGEKEFDKSVVAVGREILLVSQFTLYGDCTKGKRPSFERSARADQAEVLHERFLEILREEAPCEVKTGAFQQHMAVDLVNDGPVTVILEKESV